VQQRCPECIDQVEAYGLPQKSRSLIYYPNGSLKKPLACFADSGFFFCAL